MYASISTKNFVKHALQHIFLYIQEGIYHNTPPAPVYYTAASI